MLGGDVIMSGIPVVPLPERTSCLLSFNDTVTEERQIEKTGELDNLA
jgi:hypothetical protein